MPLTQIRRKLKLENLTLSGSEYLVQNIPAWANEINIFISGLSTNGTVSPALRIGTGGAAVNTGYQGLSGTISASNGVAGSAATVDRLKLITVLAAADTQNLGISLKRASGNKWFMEYMGYADQSTDLVGHGVSYKELAGVLDTLSFYVNGTDIFDGGNMNIEVLE